jgi:hypothetical protein
MSEPNQTPSGAPPDAGQQNRDLLELTIAAEKAIPFLHDVINRLKATRYHFNFEEWNYSRWLQACMNLEAATDSFSRERDLWLEAEPKTRLPAPLTKGQEPTK